MKKVVLFFFSGTGNTREVLSMITAALQNEGVQSECYAIDHKLMKKIPDVSGADAIGVGYPVYAFNAPGMVEAFLRKLPKGNGMPAFVFKTAGEPLLINNASSFWIHCILKMKGYKLTYERHFLMPYNIKFRFPDEVVKQIYTLSQKLAVRLVQDVVRGVYDGPKYNPAALVVAWVMLIFRPLARFNGQMYRIDKACNQCQKCARDCPTGNIRLKDGKISFGWKCTMCMRCVMYCPKGVVRAGWIDAMSVRGGYDFGKIMNDPHISLAYNLNYKKWFFKWHENYIKKMEKLLFEHKDVQIIATTREKMVK